MRNGLPDERPVRVVVIAIVFRLAEFSLNG